jgi:hypothetical protein
MEEKSGKRNHGGGIMERFFCEAFGKHLGSIWEAFGKHLGRIWEASEKHLRTYGRHLRRPSWQE